MRNCDVWKVNFESDSSCDSAPVCRWSEPTLLYRTELAEQHAFDKLIKQSDETGTGPTDPGGSGHGGAATVIPTDSDPLKMPPTSHPDKMATI